MFPFIPKKRQQHMVGIVLHLPEQYYGDFFSNAGFGSVSFGVEVTEAEFISVQSYLE